ncbi:hypothetical protein ACFQ3R_02965 [Mesonia ostreae]|uniref:Secreted protein n=1 Tax=Mesonia ostreae TaxID=861110 RepID=A0ABU2KL36_9FLAO|nr:hypothetical protein [Mesonia ostreae]MDT0295442.1 hypothetical protein [Mesonia ostreae]
MKFFKTILFTFSLLFIVACGESTDVVESGTYQGKVKEVEVEKTEIYVTTDDNKTLELYFTEATKLTKNGETVDFSMLKENQKVEVTVEKTGNRLDPISVKIME